MELPIEIVEAILDIIEDHQRLSACARVCKDWRVLCQARLFSSINLRSPSKFAQLLDILQHSPHIASAIRSVGITLTSDLPWDNNKFICNVVGDILTMLPHPTSLSLVGPHANLRAYWLHFSFKMRMAILQVLQLPSLQELTIDGWVFEIAIHTYVRNFLSSPYLRRIRLDHAFSGVYSAETVPDDFEPVTLNLHSLELRVDDHLDSNPKVQSDFNKLLKIGTSTKLSLAVLLNTAFSSFGNAKDFFTESAAGSVQKMDLTIGFRNTHIWDFSRYAQLTDLRIDARDATLSTAISLVWKILSTVTNKNKLEKLAIEFCFYALPRGQWSELISLLTPNPFPSLKRVQFNVMTNLPVDEKDFELETLREYGYQASVTFSPQSLLETFCVAVVFQRVVDVD